MTERKKHGGTREGSGRKPLDPDQPTVTTSIKLTVSQRDKLERLGGSPWVRERIDRAKEPKG
jgi:hypothetical protein